MFQSGNALFLRNWPSAWKLAEAPDSPVRGKIGVSQLPSGGAGHSAALGGWSLAVSRFSEHQEASIELVLWLASREEQKKRALSAGLNPTLPELYQDPEILASNPIAPELRRIFEQAVPRPSRATGGKYNRVSAEIRDRVHRILEERADEPLVRKEVAELDETLNRVGRKGRW